MSDKVQLDDYYDRFYNKLSEHFHILAADNFAKAKMMADWKANVRSLSLIHIYLGNPEEIRKRAEAVAKQGMAKK